MHTWTTCKEVVYWSVACARTLALFSVGGFQGYRSGLSAEAVLSTAETPDTAAAPPVCTRRATISCIAARVIIV